MSLASKARRRALNAIRDPDNYPLALATDENMAALRAAIVAHGGDTCWAGLGCGAYLFPDRSCAYIYTYARDVNRYDYLKYRIETTSYKGGK